MFCLVSLRYESSILIYATIQISLHNFILSAYALFLLYHPYSYPETGSQRIPSNQNPNHNSINYPIPNTSPTPEINSSHTASLQDKATPSKAKHLILMDDHYLSFQRLRHDKALALNVQSTVIMDTAALALGR